MIAVDKDKINNLLYAEILYEIHIAEEKLNLFQSKYLMDFNSFESKVKNASEENFTEWDDYIEWKGFLNNLKSLEDQKKAIENENNKVA